MLIWTQVASANQPPVADAGADQSGYVNEIMVLIGNATDPDGDVIVEWQWDFESMPSGSTASMHATEFKTTSFVPDLEGDYVISLIAYDGTDWSTPDTVTVTANLNQPPTAVIDLEVPQGKHR